MLTLFFFYLCKSMRGVSNTATASPRTSRHFWDTWDYPYTPWVLYPGTLGTIPVHHGSCILGYFGTIPIPHGTCILGYLGLTLYTMGPVSWDTWDYPCTPWVLYPGILWNYPYTAWVLYPGKLGTIPVHHGSCILGYFGTIPIQHGSCILGVTDLFK